MATFTWKPSTSRNLHERANYAGREDLNQTANLVHSDWEIVDPTPDVNSMFKRFDDRFFSSKLRCVELEWSKRMYSCAGICYMRKNMLGQSITIRLSEPLLKLRPRKDLVQTLLHEMIHAFAFIKGVREGNGGHGPFFHKMMNEINQVAGTAISVYHTFHDEVNVYKKHVWRCNGICKERKPFFGYVRRVSNRAPGPNDNWWSTHQADCGGYFQKISEPDKPKRAKKEKSATAGTSRKKEPVPKKDEKNQPKINDLFGSNTPKPRVTPTTAVKPPPVEDLFTEPLPAKPAGRFPGSANIRGFPDLGNPSSTSGAAGAVKPPSSGVVVPLFTGSGNVLSRDKTEKEVHQSIQDQVRNHWQKRFGNGGEGGSTSRNTTAGTGIVIKEDPEPLQNRKRRRSPKLNPNAPRPPMNQWQMLDDDIAMRTPYIPVVDLLDSESSDEESPEAQELRDHNDKLTEMSQKTVDERKTLIKQELFDDDDDEIFMIDDEFDDTLIIPGTDSGRAAGQTRPGQKISSGKVVEKSFSADDVIQCPICEGGVTREYLSEHMEEGCTGIRKHMKFVMNRNDPEIFGASSASASFFNSSTSSPSSSRVAKKSPCSPFFSRPSPPPQPTPAPAPATTVNKYPCPICNKLFPESQMNDHLDGCLS